MNSRSLVKSSVRSVLILAAIALLAYLLWQIRTITGYIAMAGVLTLIGKPLVKTLDKIHIGKFKMPTTLSVIITLLTFLSLFLTILMMLVPLISEQAENLSLLRVDEFERTMNEITNSINAQLIEIGLIKQPLEFDSSWFSDLDFSFLPTFLNSMLGAVGSVATALFSVLFISFFFLKDKGQIVNFAMELVDPQSVDKTRHALHEVKYLLSRYLIGLILQLSILFTLYVITLSVFDVSNPVIIAFLAALLNVIPYIGPLVGGIIMILLTISSNLGAESTEIFAVTLKVFLCYMGAQLFDNLVNQPLIFSNSVKAHPLEIFLVILISGTLFGIVGMVLAVPVYTILRIILKEFFSETRFVKAMNKYS